MTYILEIGNIISMWKKMDKDIKNVNREMEFILKTKWNS